MYLPAAFQETDLASMFDFIEEHSFGLLVSQGDDQPFATHLPLLLERDSGPRGTLVSHMARANPHWRYADGQPVLVVFSGPHAYISPTWYAAEHVVPTWNYVAVHAYGVLEPILETDAILDIVSRTADRYEQSRQPSWQFESGTDFAAKLVQSIVGFRIELTRLEGKWKLSQNHSLERRRSVIAGLRAEGTPAAAEVAALMEATLPS
ncbi:MAG: FMN-binding negative transcriptional regulator [Planctomycetaceae bacterium]|nr:FMN-binding negative transcriptional regulator [Planctomycetaceae bacterium]